MYADEECVSLENMLCRIWWSRQYSCALLTLMSRERYYSNNFIFHLLDCWAARQSELEVSPESHLPALWCLRPPQWWPHLIWLPLQSGEISPPPPPPHTHTHPHIHWFVGWLLVLSACSVFSTQGCQFSGKSLNSGPDYFKFQTQRSHSLHKSGTVTQFSGPRVVACWHPCPQGRFCTPQE